MPDGLHLDVTADAGQLQQELAGRSVAAVQQFTSVTKSEFDAVAAKSDGLALAVRKLPNALEAVAAASHTHMGAVQSDMVKAEQAYLMFDRTFGLGMDREMMSILQASPALTKFLGIFAGGPGIAALVGVMVLSKAIEAVSKSLEEAEHAGEKWASGSREMELRAQTHADSLQVETDRLDAQIARLEHRPEDKLGLAIDEDIQRMGQLVSAVDGALNEIDKRLDDSKQHFGAFGAMLLTLKEEIKNETSSLIPSDPTVIHGDTKTVEDLQSIEGQLHKVTSAWVQAQNAAGDNPFQKQAAGAQEGAAYIDKLNWAIETTEKQLEKMKTAGKGEDYSQAIAVESDVQQRYIQLRAETQRTIANNAKQATVSAEQTAQDKNNKAIAQQEASLGAHKAVQEAKVKASEDAAKRQYAAGAISLEQETAALEKAENNRFRIIESALAQQTAMARSRGGPEGANQATTLAGERAAAEVAHQDKLAELRAGAGERERAETQQIGMQQLQLQEQLAIARERGTQEQTRSQLAQHQISAQDAETAEEASENRLYGIKAGAANAELALLGTNSEKNRVEIARLHNDLQMMEVEHQTAIQSIQDAAYEREQAKQAAAAAKSYTSAEADNNRKLQDQQRANAGTGEKGATSGEIAGKDLQALNAWYEAEKTLYTEMEGQYANDAAQYAAVIEKKKALDENYSRQKELLLDKETAATRNWANQQTQMFTPVLDAWLTHSEHMSKAWRDMGDHMVVSTINSLAQILEKKAANYIADEALHLGSVTTQQAIDSAAAATASTAAAAQHAEQGMLSASTAAKNTYAVVSGWPVVGPILAPEAAAAAFIAVAAFERGGVVPLGPGGAGAGVPILAHPGERVLTPDQTANFHDLVDNSSQSAPPPNFVFSPQISAIDGPSVERMVRTNSSTFMREAQRQTRNSGQAQGRSW